MVKRRQGFHRDKPQLTSQYTSLNTKEILFLIGIKIQSAREANSETQEQLATLFGTSRSSVQRLEIGEIKNVELMLKCLLYYGLFDDVCIIIKNYAEKLCDTIK